MKLPPAAYIAIAILAGVLLLIGLGICAAAVRGSKKFFNLGPVRRVDMRLGRRNARWFCLTVGVVSATLGAILLSVSLLLLVPKRRLRSIDSFDKLPTTSKPADDGDKTQQPPDDPDE